MNRLLVAAIIAVLLLLSSKSQIIADTIDATYSTITSEIVPEVKSSRYGMEVIDCQVEIKNVD